MSEVMKPVCDVIHKFVDWLHPVLAAVKFVGDVFRDIRTVLDEVLDAVKHIKWALDAVDCIFKELMQPLVWIMKVRFDWAVLMLVITFDYYFDRSLESKL